MSFQRFAVKLAPLSEVTREGRPQMAAQWCRNALAASVELASRRGTAWRFRVVRQTAVSSYLNP